VSEADPKSPIPPNDEQIRSGEINTSAADEPTAVWDDSALVTAGLRPHATESRTSQGSAEPIVRTPSQPPSAPQTGVRFWVMTLALAAIAAVAVYFLVRLLKG